MLHEGLLPVHRRMVGPPWVLGAPHTAQAGGVECHHTLPYHSLSYHTIQHHFTAYLEARETGAGGRVTGSSSTPIRVERRLE